MSSVGSGSGSVSGSDKLNKNILQVYRDMLYSEQKICNEKRITFKKDLVYWPLQDYYPRKVLNAGIYEYKIDQLPFMYYDNNKIIEEKVFYKKLNEDRIKYAIKYLQVEALKKYFGPTCFNPLIYLTEMEYPIEHNIDAVTQIIKIIIDNNNYGINCK